MSGPADPPPLRPIEPVATECCGEGCARCVFDIYDEALARYAIELAGWRERQSPLTLQNPESDTPDPDK